MIETPVRTVNDLIADFLACKPSDEDVIGFYMPPDLQRRMHFLLDLNGEDELTADEARELEGVLRANGFVSLVKAKIKRRQRLGRL